MVALRARASSQRTLLLKRSAGLCCCVFLDARAKCFLPKGGMHVSVLTKLKCSHTWHFLCMLISVYHAHKCLWVHAIYSTLHSFLITAQSGTALPTPSHLYSLSQNIVRCFIRLFTLQYFLWNVQQSRVCGPLIIIIGKTCPHHWHFTSLVCFLSLPVTWSPS